MSPFTTTTQRIITRHLALGLLLLLVGTSGCSSLKPNHAAHPPGPPSTATEPATAPEPDIAPTVVAYHDYNDPLIKINRAVFAFNDVAYRYALIPLAKGYRRVVPDAVDQSVGNFFYNIKAPVYATNHLLQMEFEPAGINLARFLINTTLGLAGLFDPAQAWFDLEKKETHFEQTLMQYEVGRGVYLVLPLLGPSDLRNGTSQLFDYYLNPIPRLLERPDSTLVLGYGRFQEFAPEADRYLVLRRKSEDPYIFFRNYYLQGVRRDEDY